MVSGRAVNVSVISLRLCKHQAQWDSCPDLECRAAAPLAPAPPLLRREDADAVVCHLSYA